jgi:hypothetical protein
MSTEYSHPFTPRLVDIEDSAIEIWEGGDGPVTFVTMHQPESLYSPDSPVYQRLAAPG